MRQDNTAAYTNRKKVGGALFIWTSGFQSKDVRDDEGHFGVTALGNQGAMKILNIHAPNNKIAKSTKAKMGRTTTRNG